MIYFTHKIWTCLLNHHKYFTLYDAQNLPWQGHVFFCQHIFTVIKNFIDGFLLLYHVHRHTNFRSLHWLYCPLFYCSCFLLLVLWMLVGRSHMVHSCRVHWQGYILCIRKVFSETRRPREIKDCGRGHPRGSDMKLLTSIPVFIK